MQQRKKRIRNYPFRLCSLCGTLYFGVGWCWFVCFVRCCLYAYLLCKEVVVHKTLNHLHIYKIIRNFSLAFREREREPKSFRRHTDTHAHTYHVIVRTLNIYNQFYQLFSTYMRYMHVLLLFVAFCFYARSLFNDVGWFHSKRNSPRRMLLYHFIRINNNYKQC